MPTKEKGRSLIYLRVSTGGQAKKELPVETQKDACLRFASERGYICDPNKDIYVDHVSGRKIEGRHELQRLLNRSREEKHVTAVIVYDISRLSRNAIEYYTLKEIFKKAQVTLLSVNEHLPEDDSPASWLMEYMISGFAEFRSRQDGEKIRKSMTNKVLNGGYCGLAKYGYKNVQEQTSSNKAKRWIEPDEREAPWVTRIHTLYATGTYSLKALAQKMQEEGMSIRNGKRVNASLIHRILRDETYVGVVSWGGVRCDKAEHTHLVQKDIFDQNQAILDARNAGASDGATHLAAMVPPISKRKDLRVRLRADLLHFEYESLKFDIHLSQAELSALQ